MKNEAEILRSLYETYLNLNERAKGKLGDQRFDSMGADRGARVAQGGGRLGVFTPARGQGADKRHKNNPKADDARAQIQKDQAKEDRKSPAEKASMSKSPSMQAAQDKAKFKPHEGPMKVKKLRPARGPRR